MNMINVRNFIFVFKIIKYIEKNEFEIEFLLEY